MRRDAVGGGEGRERDTGTRLEITWMSEVHFVIVERSRYVAATAAIDFFPLTRSRIPSILAFLFSSVVHGIARRSYSRVNNYVFNFVSREVTSYALNGSIIPIDAVT